MQEPGNSPARQDETSCKKEGALDHALAPGGVRTDRDNLRLGALCKEEVQYLT